MKSYSGFSYKVYLAVNEGDEVFSNEVIVESLFRSAYIHWGQHLPYIDFG